jgi:hypothetical protein
VALLSLVLAVVGCSTSIALTDAGTRVQHIARTEIPPGCRLLGDVAIGIPPDAATPRSEEELSILMRNKAAEQGGTHVVTETSESQTDESGQPYYRGRGTAYSCGSGGTAPPEEPGEAPPEETTSGGEDTGAGQEGPSNEDLLGDD